MKLLGILVTFNLLFLLSVQGFANTGTFQLTSGDNSVKLNTFLNDLTAELPTSFKSQIHKKISVEFVELNSLPLTETFQCADEDSQQPIRWAEVRKPSFKSWKSIDTIYIDQKILTLIKKDFNVEFPNNCSHPTLKTFVESLFIHELAHIYDYSANRVGIDRKEELRCKEKLKKSRSKGPRKRSSPKPKDARCSRFVSSSRAVSDSPYLQNALGWIEKGITKKRQNLNQNFLRSPNPYEFTSPKEAYAVNFEYFTLDKEYKCRRPTIYNYFSHIFNSQPFADYQCDSYNSVSLRVEKINGELLQKVDIDPNRIYSIDYLFAGQGDSLISRWGHAMYRLVICKEGRPLGPDCRHDYSDHLVVSYRANMDELNVDYGKGMDGSYSSQLLILKFSEVREEYTVGELRELFSLPLNLTEEEKARFLNAMLEQYWRYRGQYFFLSNNCATEALNLLKMAKFSNQFERQSTLTPLGLYDDFGNQGIIDKSLLNNSKQAKLKGYYYPPAHLRLVKAFNNLQQIQPNNELSDIDSFISDSDAENRKAYYEEIKPFIVDEPMSTKVRVLSSMAMIEDFVIQREVVILNKRLAGKFIEGDYEISDDDANKSLQSLIKTFKVLFVNSLPENMAQSGYGIPQKSEFSESAFEEVNTSTEAFLNAFEELKMWVRGEFAEAFEQITLTSENLTELKADIACTTGLLSLISCESKFAATCKKQSRIHC